MMSKLNNFHNLFVSRVCDGNIPRASLWLLYYASLPTALVSILIVVIIGYYVPEWTRTLGGAPGQQNLGLFPSLIFNPLFESLILTIAIRAGARLKIGKFSIVVSALLLAIIHSLQSLFWGVTVFYFFLVQSYAFFYGMKFDSKRSYIVLSAAHSLHNTWILIALLCLRYFV